MPEFTAPEKCALCGHTDKRDLTYRLAHWLEAPPGMAYEHVPRCREDAECRTRLALAKKRWPLVENPKLKSA